MTVFNIKNPRHKQILKEELTRVKRILSEGFQYSTDEIWSLMTDDEKTDLLLSSADDDGPDRAEEYTDGGWDDIPADIQDTLDMSEFELAKYDSAGRTNIRAIDSLTKRLTNANSLVSKFLAKTGRFRVHDLTIKQSAALLIAIHKFQDATGPSSSVGLD
tara:strand:+ start:1023 stop:1502 length:480 start_codon:yes stop_codon:yes gene_type:complete